MVDSNLIIILKTFSKEEMKLFAEFVRSPYFNKNENIVTLHDYLEKYHPDFPSAKIEKEKVYLKIFRENKYDDRRMRFFISELFRLAGDFATINGNEYNPISKLVSLSKKLGDRTQYKLAGKLAEQASEKLIGEKNKNAELLYLQFLLSNTTFLNSFNSSINKENTMEELISKYNPVKSLTTYFLYQYIELMLNLTSKSNDYNYTINTDISNELYTLLKDIAGKEEPILKLKYLQLKVRLHKNIADIKLLEKTLDEEQEHISAAEIRDICFVMIVAYNSMIMSPRPDNKLTPLELTRNILEIYKKMLRMNLLVTDNIIETIVFRNIITHSCVLKEMDFLEDFISKYKVFLLQEERDDIVNYGLAQLNFCRKNYNNVLKYLNKSRYIMFYQQLDQKVLLILVFYEQNDEEPFLSHLNSTSRLLKNDKEMPESRKKMYTDFIHFTGSLFKEKRSVQSKQRVLKLKKEIEANQRIVRRGWLLEKLEEIE